MAATAQSGLSFAKCCYRETAVVQHLRMALLSHIPSCIRPTRIASGDVG
jgi:hypothetical protein